MKVPFLHILNLIVPNGLNHLASLPRRTNQQIPAAAAVRALELMVDSFNALSRWLREERHGSFQGRH